MFSLLVKRSMLPNLKFGAPGTHFNASRFGSFTHVQLLFAFYIQSCVHLKPHDIL